MFLVIHRFKRFIFKIEVVSKCAVSIRSEDALFIVLELHNDRLDVLSLILPLLDALLSVGVEVLLVLILQGLVLQTRHLSFLELLNSLLVLEVSLSFLEVLEFSSSEALFLLLLLLSKL